MKVPPASQAPNTLSWWQWRRPTMNRPRRRATFRGHQGRRVSRVGSLLAALLLGYGVAAVVQQRPTRSLPLTTEVAATDSFSEAQALKGLLNRLYLDYVVDLHQEPAGFGALRTDRVARQRLEALIAEFSGTDQAVSLTHVLLTALARDGLPDQWLDVFLGMAYEHPTHPTVAIDLVRAREIGVAIGREAEVEAVMRHLANIPTEVIRRGSANP